MKAWDYLKNTAWPFIRYLPSDIMWEIRHFLELRGVPRWVLYPIRSYKDWEHYRQFPVGTVVEDCSYHPGVIVKNVKGDVDVKSLIDGNVRSCSLFHCGIIKLNEHEVEVRKEAYAKGGTKGLLRLVGWSDEDFETYKDYSF